jgi:hypothetical protein
MKSEQLRVYGYLRRLCLASALVTGLAMVAGGAPGLAQSVDPDAIAGNSETVSELSAFDTTVAYVAQFYPLLFTYYQSRLGNRSEGKRLWDRQLRNANSESERSIRHRGVRSRQYDALGGSGFDQLLRKILPMAGLECNGPLCCVE